MRVVLLLSGGIDSAAAGRVLVDRGAEVVGVTLDLGDNRCCQLELARRICGRLSIPHYVYNLKERFRTEIIETYKKRLYTGLTPNPCPECNLRIKFLTGLRIADEIGADLFATGHYARKRRGDGWELLEAKDLRVSQAYFLALIDQRILDRIIFPIGDLMREEVEEIGRGIGGEFLSSQEICFDPELLERPGEVVDRNGRVLGRHRGYYFYTIGQRHGLGIGGGTPFYVIAKECQENRIVVGSREELLTTRFRVGGIHWISTPPRLPIRVEVRVRYQSEPIPGEVGSGGEVFLDRPHFAITPGQLAVFSKGERILGGGWIDA
ncbi:tRNA 2-thiouridine(34) synthase MnmA [candidate division WOR-3 bacterium]|uniref:tRNA-specific 2-thiouridylase MnmA n=1 Tax=candidate division WOR-3 bacterium TaxID=2052148 RepID=A0A660SN79_UNCW3|nr:MAG: tRNA 2-thiouridine(34) synthase MnmA [candidate division WOR-3 bacterium]